ncbi:E3 ubiquitin-protein ligase RNF149 isoform X3 [Pongo abelii]|uniref:E3 ubiquitin-protein ligase RNF149 isoform X3 n=1 Tax=Pongo abelii TaxID=9601 RepID=UPI0023E76569|nr:E3 ubiquitin-protein ligase RNF149 isoform X2 [Pongo abelii]
MAWWASRGRPAETSRAARPTRASSCPSPAAEGPRPGSPWWLAGAAPSRTRCWWRRGGTPRPSSSTMRSATGTSPCPCLTRVSRPGREDGRGTSARQPRLGSSGLALNRRPRSGPGTTLRPLAVGTFREALVCSVRLPERCWEGGTGNIVVIMISYPKGREILELVQKGIPVTMTIGVGTRHVQEFISGQSVVFVAIAFITMMIISLAWLIFYYIQRFLYTGSQIGSQSHRKETKKVIGQLLLHTVKHGEKGIDVDAENCAVCIENFKVKDIIRILPCKHIFHRICIDPWLLDHRTCPMCKLDVIKALGYWGEPGDVQEMPAPESPPGRDLAANLSLTLPDDDGSDESSPPSASPAESEPQCDPSFKGDAGENTALLEAGRSDSRHGGPIS